MGAWIEICAPSLKSRLLSCRTPRWVRGLKSSVIINTENAFVSHPTMGAWIEIFQKYPIAIKTIVAPHDGCVDWNIQRCRLEVKGLCRTPRWVRGLKSCTWMLGHLAVLGRTPRWVRGLKFLFCPPFLTSALVAPHDGCVDWNLLHL